LARLETNLDGVIRLMSTGEEKKLKVIEGVKKQSERYGFPTYPNKKKKTDKKKNREK